MANKRDPHTERKLRPLYDALDNLNNKQAIQRADKILKKEEDFHCARVLKALAMVRLMKCEEALAILEDVKTRFPLDESTLQAMSLCYKELLLPENIPELYETALKYSENSEDYLTQLFMGYVRIKEYQKQQQTATKLHKLTGITAYSYWNAVSLVFMGKNNPDLGKMMCFPLAMKIIEKSKEKSPETAEEVFRLYLEVLELMGLHDRALEELANSKNIIVDERERLRFKLHFLKILGKVEETNILYKQAIVSEPDCYDFYRGYFDTSFTLLHDTEQLHDLDFQFDLNKADTSVREMTGLLLKVSEDSGGALRGPELAKAELVIRLRERNIELCSFASPHLLVLEYVSKFGHKSCCYDDLKCVIDRMSSTEQGELIKVLEEYRTTVKESNGTKAMQRLASLHLILHHVGRYSNLEGESLLYNLEEIRNFHQITLEVDLDCSYVETFAQIYTWMTCDNSAKTNIVDAVKLLYNKLESFPEGAGCRILATTLFAHLGAIGPAAEMYNGLDTKSIQTDSLSHILYPNLIPLGAFSVADKGARRMESFYRTNEREVLECIVKSYLCGKFHKVTELFELHDSLVYSISKAVVLLDKVWLSFLLCSAPDWNQIEVLLTTAREEMTAIRTDKLIDNRDYQVNEICDSRHTEMVELQRSCSYTHDTLYVKLRHFMITSLLVLQDTVAAKNMDSIDSVIATFTTDVIQRMNGLPNTEGFPIYLVMSERMTAWEPFLNTLVTITREARNYAMHLVHGDNVKFDLQLIADSIAELQKKVGSELLVDETLNSRHLTRLSCLIETMWYGVMCVLCGAASAQRKKRALADTAITHLRESVASLKSLLEDCSLTVTSRRLYNLNLQMDDTVESKIARSIKWSIDEFIAVVNRLSTLISSVHSRLKS